MRVEMVKGQSFTTQKQQSRATTQPSFGISIKTADEFKTVANEFGITKAVAKVIKKALRKHAEVNQALEISKGEIRTNLGEPFGILTENFASRHIGDLSDSINRLAIKSKLLEKLSEHIEKLNTSNKLNIQLEKSALESPEALFYEHFNGGDSYKNVTNEITNAAKSLSRIPDKENYILRLKFENSYHGLVKAKLVDAKDENIFSEFILDTKKNPQSIEDAIVSINEQYFKKQLFNINPKGEERIQKP